MIGMIILAIIHALILIGGITVSLLLPAQITSTLVISLVFSSIAYLVFAAATLFAAYDAAENVIQNGGLIMSAVIYLLAALVLGFLCNLLHMPTKIHVLLEIVVMIAGIVFALVMYLAKRHIEDLS